MRELIVPVAVNIAVVAVIAKIYVDFGLSALVFVLLNVLVVHVHDAARRDAPASARGSTRTSRGACSRA